MDDKAKVFLHAGNLIHKLVVYELAESENKVLFRYMYRGEVKVERLLHANNISVAYKNIVIEYEPINEEVGDV